MSSAGHSNSFDAAGRKSGPWSEPDSHGGTMTGAYVDGDRVGLWRHFAGDGRLRSEGGFERGELHGAWTWYRANGVLLQKGTFHHGTKEGTWERWDAQGNHLDSTRWKRGRKCSPKGVIAHR